MFVRRAAKQKTLYIIITKTGSFDSGLLVLVLVAAPLMAATCLFSLARFRYGSV